MLSDTSTFTFGKGKLYTQPCISKLYLWSGTREIYLHGTFKLSTVRSCRLLSTGLVHVNYICAQASVKYISSQIHVKYICGQIHVNYVCGQNLYM